MYPPGISCRVEGKWMENSERKDRGIELLQRMIGEEEAECVRERWKKICPDFEQYIVEFVSGDVWSRPGLDLRTKSLVTIAVLASQGRTLGLELNIRMAVNNGATKEEIVETLLQIGPYTGFATVWEALAMADDVFAKM